VRAAGALGKKCKNLDAPKQKPLRTLSGPSARSRQIRARHSLNSPHEIAIPEKHDRKIEDTIAAFVRRSAQLDAQRSAAQTALENATKARQDDEPVVINLTCVNHGTADAFLQQIGVRYFVVRSDRELPIKTDISANVGLIGATLSSGLNYVLPNIKSETILSAAENTAIQQGDARLFCVGYVSYFDQARRLRITGFCRVLTFPLQGIAHRENSRFRKFDDPDYEYED
jgi:hypothetical protein